MGDFNASTGTDRRGYGKCVGPFGSGTLNENGVMFLDFARSQGFRVAGSWYQRPELHRWSWYSNTGDVAKEIDHILVDGRWRLLQDCRVFRGAHFMSIDHRLVVAKLKLRLKSEKIKASKQKLDVEKFKDQAARDAYAARLGSVFMERNVVGDSVEMWETYRDNLLSVAEKCIGYRKKQARKSFLSAETLSLVERSRRARLEGNSDLARRMKRESIRSLREDKERQVRGICESVESHLWSSVRRSTRWIEMFSGDFWSFVGYHHV